MYISLPFVSSCYMLKNFSLHCVARTIDITLMLKVSEESEEKREKKRKNLFASAAATTLPNDTATESDARHSKFDCRHAGKRGREEEMCIRAGERKKNMRREVSREKDGGRKKVAVFWGERRQDAVRQMVHSSSKRRWRRGK